MSSPVHIGGNIENCSRHCSQLDFITISLHNARPLKLEDLKPVSRTVFKSDMPTVLQMTVSNVRMCHKHE